MIAQYGKRVLSLFLAIVMILSVVPVQAFAEEAHDHQDENVATSTPVQSEGSAELIALRAEIAAYIEALGITPDMPDYMLLYAYGNHSSYEAAQASLTKQDEFWEKGALLSAEEQEILLAEENTKLCQRYREVVEEAYGMQILADFTVNGVNFSATTGTLTESGGSVTASVKGQGGCDSKAATMTIYIQNNSGEAGTVSFNMAQTNVNSIKAGNENIKGKTSYAKALEADGEFSITITTDKNDTTNKVVFSDITFTSASKAFTVTVEYPTANGSVASSVEGTSAEVDGTTTMTLADIDATNGVTLTATSSTFLCWVDKDNKFLSSEKTYKVLPSADTTVKAVMTGGNAHFLVNGNLVYDDLNKAVKMAETASNKTVVLMNNGTLPAGTYTIPSGITLLIPFDAANTLYTSEPGSVDANGTPTAYRTLTMESGANITINGALSLSAKHSNKQLHNGRPIGAISFINMKSDSKITVNKGGNLYAWGYITGDGSVEVKSGATVYENFQVMDWRGGSAGTGMIGNKNRVFLMSQYYIQNIEVPMTIHAGASERAYTSVTLPILGAVGSNVPFIGASNSMFTISDGYIIKDYREGTGRLDIDVYGDVSVSKISISLSAYTVNSADYELPLNGNLTIQVHRGNINLNQNVAFQPGSELYVHKDAVCNLGADNSIYVYDYEDWGPYVYNDGSEYKNPPYVPGGVGTEGRGKDALIQIDGTAVLNGTAYTTAGGANIISSGTGVIVIGKVGTQTVTYQAEQANTSISYTKIGITPFKLKNADGNYVDTKYLPGTYTYTDGVWVKTSCTHVFDETITKAPTCTETGLKNQVCKDTVNCGHVVENVEVPALGHTAGADATCTTAQTCTVCGAEIKKALGHTEATTAPVAPTCTETGLTEGKHCSVCNAVIVAQEVVPALGHKPGAAATCTKAQTCTVCNAELVKALGHTAVADAAKAPTCTETGLTEGSHCSVCNEVLIKQDVVDALGHTAGAEATCTEAQTCTVCGAEIKKALGHTEAVDAAKAPTCTETGLTEGKHCSVCNTVLVKQDVVDALGHNPGAEATCTTAQTCTVCNAELVKALGHKPGAEATCTTAQTCTVCGAELAPALNHDLIRDNEIPATCTEPGSQAGAHCSRCDYTEGGGEIPALGHKPGAEATCTTAQTCTVCGAEIKKALGHTEAVDAAKAPTCTETGLTEGKHCSVCNTVIDAQEEVPALGHKPGAEATCTTAQTCTVCNAELVKTLGHNPGAEATCTTAQTCTVCNAELVAALDHDKIVHNAKAPTCTEHGWEAYLTCSRCDYTTYVEIPAAGHGLMQHKDAIAATCQKEGVVEHWLCPVCSGIFADEAATQALESITAPIDPNNHAYATEGQTTAATCKAEGKIEYPCQNEGCEEARVETLPVDPEGHVWDEGEENGNHSCNSALKMKYTCTLCEETKLVVVKEQHFRVPIADEIPATCTTDGMTSGWKCEKCDEFWIPQEVIPALGHDWNGALPCQSETSACTRCDLHFDTKQEHLVVTVTGTPATCTTTGLTDGAYCGYCGKTLVEQTEIPMTEHNWITTELEIPATCNTVGHDAGATYCMDCDYDENAKPALEHKWVHRDAKKATYSAIGWTAHDFCMLCNAVKSLELYEEHPCESCGENPEGYIEIPKVEIQSNATIEEFLTNLGYLEMMAEQYALTHPGTDPLGLVLNYLRTGVANYTSGSWAIMAGAENKDFLKFVQEMEDSINSNPDIDVWVNVSGLKKLQSYYAPNGEKNIYSGNNLRILTGHFFGTMDMTYHNKGSQNHADVGGWIGDLTDLLSTSDEFGVPANRTLEEKVEYVREKYLFKDTVSGSAGAFGSQDLYADLDAYYIMNELIANGYNTGDLTRMLSEYYSSNTSIGARFSYLMDNRLDGLSTRKDLRTAVYNAYTSNKLIATLEGTRNFNASGNELAELRKAVCYAFADEMCYRAGDFVEDLENPRYTVFDTETKILAPGVSQQISYATNADGKQIVFYIATADVNRDDVGLWVNYYDRDPGTPENPEWKNNSVPSSAQNAQDRFGDPSSSDYIPNFNVVASTNAGGYDMSDTATPGGLVVMDGVEWYPQTNTAGFFAIMDDGTAYMGTHDQYQALMDAGRIKEAIGGFGEFVVKDGKVVGNATYSDAPRTSVGITKTGRVVIMCIDGRQAPFSSGASLQDVGYIMREAGCVIAINLDGGGSTTFVARQPGSDELTVMNRPSDGYPRNVSTNLLIYSTAPSSTAFDHAVIESEYDYATTGTPVQMNAAGVSPSGNAVDVPEGATWAVSDEAWATISEDGVFIGKRLGEVYVYLMLDGQVVGSKLMTIAKPDQLYFEKTKVDAIYGSSVKLPLRARYEGKAIAINPNDVTITLSAPAAGKMEGFNFVATESSVKTLTITAALSDGAKASVNVMLYKQGENSFDFDKATGGDRMLAWHRDVTNAKIEDGNIYNVIDPSKDMVTSYTFALDMTAIPIPERLEELTYMLPGGTLEGANAWTFLTSLAQRISDLSWVKATIDFDDRFVVDYSQLNILNDYFTMKGIEFDETTNTLTVTMNWIRQSQVINAATANPLCLINGLKLTPKEGVWEDVSKINVVTSGNIGYEIYMRASGLYSFAQKPESQAVFGLYPYRNPNDTSDAGGYFRDTYAQITDEYTLVNAVKEGWINEDGGFAYYVEGERLTGIQQVEGFYYDFGETGVNVGQTKFTGLFFDEEANAYRYSYIGELASGWQSINGDWYYFNPKNNSAVSGYFKISGVKFHFEEDGKLTSGVWANTLKGTRYYYGPGVYWNLWHEVDGQMYYFSEGYRVTGYNWVTYPENVSKYGWAYFDENGKYVKLEDGVYKIDDNYFYFENGYSVEKGLVYLNGEYYFTVSRGRVITNVLDYYAYMTSCDMPCGHYSFDAEGRMIGSSAEGEVALKNGVLYYFERGVGMEKGLVCVDGDYYFTVGRGRVITNEVKYAYLTNCDLPCGHYEFGADGKMLQGIVEKNGTYYYYENGMGAEKGLICVDGDYYFTVGRGRVITNEIKYAYLTNCDLPCGHYEFGADGKMVGSRKSGEIVEKDGTLYYYENGAGVEKGLVCVEGEYYFTVGRGRVITNEVKYAYLTNCDMPCGSYEFGPDGKMIGSSKTGEIVVKDGTMYYYESGAAVEKGLIYLDGAYYYTVGRGRVITNEVKYAYLTNCDMPCGNYEFGPDGKMIGSSKTGEIVVKDGTMYYYESGAAVEKGLIYLNGEYYFTVNKGRIIVNEVKYAYLTNCDLPCGHYEFGPDGTMVGSSATGEIVNKNGVDYYYEKGQKVSKGLVKLDGEYYYIIPGGTVVKNKMYYVGVTNDLLPAGNYDFDADGKMIGSDPNGEIINRNGVLYYYENGVRVNQKGLVYIDGHYYFVGDNGRLAVNCRQNVWEANGLLIEGYYTFNELGQLVS